jgi:hypothetical protein
VLRQLDDERSSQPAEVMDGQRIRPPDVLCRSSAVGLSLAPYAFSATSRLGNGYTMCEGVDWASMTVEKPTGVYEKTLLYIQHKRQRCSSPRQPNGWTALLLLPTQSFWGEANTTNRSSI